MRKLWMPLGIIVIIALGGLVTWFKMSADVTEPEIFVDEDELAEYYEDISDEELLAGVSAEDDRDGDVSDSLVVESVSDSEEDGTVTVVYVASDSSGNVARVNWLFSLTDGSSLGINEDDTDAAEEDTEDEEDTSEADTEDETDAYAAEDEDEDADATDDATSELEEDTTEDLTDEELAVLERDEAIAELDAAAPRIYLSEHYVTVAVGSSFTSTSYVEEIEDDSDDRSTLFRRIIVNGEVSTGTAGTYELTYYVTDTDGNQSNVETLIVTVQ